MIINGNAKYVTLAGEYVDYSNNITRESAAHKYGGDPMAEYIDQTQDCLKFIGDDEYGFTCEQHGKRLLVTDNRGFVSVRKYASVAEADGAFDIMEQDYLVADTADRRMGGEW